MSTNCFRISMLSLCLSLCVSSVAQVDSIFIRGYINNVEDKDLSFILYEPTGITGGIMRWLEGKNEGRPKEGELDFVFRFRNSGSHYFEIRHALDLPWSLMDFGFWASKGDTVKIEGDGYLNATWRVTTNSPEQREQNIYQEACMEEIKAYQSAVWDYAKYRDWRKDAPDMNEEEWDKTTAHMKSLEATKDSLGVVLKKKLIEVLKERPVGNAWVRSFVRMIHFTDNTLADELKELYLHKEQEVKQRPDADLLWSMVHESAKAKLNEACIDGKMHDLDNRIYHLKDFYGKYVLLTFWSRSCGPCIDHLPEMAAFHEKHKDRLVMINLTTDEDDTWRKSPYHSQITWYNLSDGRSLYGLAKSYELKSLPYHVLISPYGIYKKNWRGSDNIFESGELERCIQ